MSDEDDTLAAEEDEEEAESDLGARLGLALVSGFGLLLGGLTGVGLWALYPPVRGHAWPMPLLVGVSVLLVAVLYIAFRRRAGTQAADWFVLGYIGALVLGLGVLLGGEAAEFVREHLPPSVG